MSDKAMTQILLDTVQSAWEAAEANEGLPEGVIGGVIKIIPASAIRDEDAHMDFVPDFFPWSDLADRMHAVFEHPTEGLLAVLRVSDAYARCYPDGEPDGEVDLVAQYEAGDSQVVEALAIEGLMFDGSWGRAMQPYGTVGGLHPIGPRVVWTGTREEGSQSPFVTEVLGILQRLWMERNL